MSVETWYATLLKPAWAPPAWLFGPVWSVLYVVIFLSFGAVFYKIWTRELSLTVGVPFLLNIVLNLLFTPIQFGLKSNLLALLDILLVLLTLVWAIVVIYPQVRWIAYAQIPYLFWVLFATALQISVTYLNA